MSSKRISMVNKIQMSKLTIDRFGNVLWKQIMPRFSERDSSKVDLIWTLFQIRTTYLLYKLLPVDNLQKIDKNTDGIICHRWIHFVCKFGIKFSYS